MSVCKAWVEPARLLLWREFRLLTHRKVRQLASIEDGPFHHIRHIEVSVPHQQSSPSLYKNLESILTRLPTSLKSFTASLPEYKASGPEGRVTLFDLLFLRPQINIHTKSLALAFPSELYDISKLIARFNGLTELTILVDPLAHKYQHHSSHPMTSVRLRKLHLDLLQKDMLPGQDSVTSHADNLSKLLTPACVHLEYLKISMTDTTEDVWYRFNRLYNLGSHSLTHLELVYKDLVPGRQAYTCVPALDPRAYSTADPNPFPNLDTLILHEFGISVNLIAALSPSNLRTLKMIVPPKAGMGDGWEEPEVVLQVLELLPNLERLEVRFASLSSSMFEAIRVKKRRGAFETRKMWAVVEEDERVKVFHPDIVEEKKPALPMMDDFDDEDLL